MKRILRVIEYVGDDEFLSACIDRRSVKGTFHPGRQGCYIREAILGDTAEVLSPTPPPDPDFDAPEPTPTIPLVRPRDETIRQDSQSLDDLDLNKF